MITINSNRKLRARAVIIYCYFVVCVFLYSILGDITAYCKSANWAKFEQTPIKTEEFYIENIVDNHIKKEPITDTIESSPGYEEDVVEHKDNTFCLSEQERYIVEQVVMAECGHEEYEGIVAVAQCIYNTALYKDSSPADIVQVPGQYSPPSKVPANDKVKKAVSQVFDEEVFYVEDKIMYFYAPKYCSGSWHESSPNLVYSCTIGGHKFFKLRWDW